MGGDFFIYQHQMLMLRKILINYIEVGGSKTSRAKRNLQHQKCPKTLEKKAFSAIVFPSWLDKKRTEAIASVFFLPFSSYWISPPTPPHEVVGVSALAHLWASLRAGRLVQVGHGEPKNPECESIQDFYFLLLHYSLITKIAFRDFWKVISNS